MTIEQIADKEYLGRMIIIGRTIDGRNDVVAYAVTGRSPPSRARELIRLEDGTIKTNVTDEKQLKEGNPKLLIYNAIRRYHDSFIVTNGAQTDLVFDTMERLRMAGDYVTPAGILVKSFERPYLVEGNKPDELIDLTLYEPDPPNWTPRISGVLTRDVAALSIVRWNDGIPERNFFEFSLMAGKGKMLATYTGQNVPKGVTIPSFRGEPLDVCLFGSETPKDVADLIYYALKPKEAGPGIISPGDDFRVGVACMFYQRIPIPKMTSFIINREAGK